MRRPAVAWLALIVPLWAAMAFCTANAPVVFDAWTPYFWHRSGMTAWHFAVENYRFNNPRLGHVLSVPVSLPPWSVIVMPLIDLAAMWLAASLALGRLASPRRAGDAFVMLVVAGLFVACSPAVGPMLFYAPYTGNYVLGFVLALGFLAPYRFALAAPRPRPWSWAAVMLFAGAAAGMCNEHTAPAIGLLALAAAIYVRRPPPWMIAGLVGFAAGAAALYLAPGQHFRYAGLAGKHTALEWLGMRGVLGFLRLARSTGRHLWWCLPFAALVAWGVRTQRAARAAESSAAPSRSRTWPVPAALVAAALVIVATLLASPKLGDRLLFAPAILACIATTDLVARYVTSPRPRAIAALIAIGLLVHAGWRCIRAYRELGPESAARLAVLEHAAPHTTVTLPAFTVDRSRYSAADDLGDAVRRKTLAGLFGLADIELAGSAASDVEAP